MRQTVKFGFSMVTVFIQSGIDHHILKNVTCTYHISIFDSYSKSHRESMINSSIYHLQASPQFKLLHCCYSELITSAPSFSLRYSFLLLYIH